MAVPLIVTRTDTATFRADRAWGAKDLAEIDGATVRLHWTDEPYKWHRNDGTEVFVVLDGAVDMHYRLPGGPKAWSGWNPERFSSLRRGRSISPVRWAKPASSS